MTHRTIRSGMPFPDWTLSVENYGRIWQGEIRLAPLVIMIGLNNSGKSYVTSLLWGLLNPVRSLFPHEPTINASYRRCRALVRTIRDGTKTTVDDEDWRVLADWVGDVARK